MDTLLFLVCRNQNFSWNCQEESKLKFCKDHSFSLKAVGHIKTTTNYTNTLVVESVLATLLLTEDSIQDSLIF